MTPLVSDHAFLLKKINYLERDQIITMLTKTHGKLTFFAKGGQVSKNRFVNIDFFTLLNIEFSSRMNKSMVTLVSGSVDSIYPAVRKNLFSFAAASYITEVLAHFLPSSQTESELFHLYQVFLESITSGTDKPRVFLYFLVKLLTASGFPVQWPASHNSQVHSIIRTLQVGSIESVSSMEIPDHTIVPAINLVNDHIGHVVRKPIKSVDYLKSVLRTTTP